MSVLRDYATAVSQPTLPFDAPAAGFGDAGFGATGLGGSGFDAARYDEVVDGDGDSGRGGRASRRTPSR